MQTLKGLIIARELLLGIIQPIYRYAAVSFFMVLSWLYIFTLSVILFAISFFSENIGPLSRVSNNDGNLSATCLGICLTCWVLHAFFQIYQIGTEQDLHATSLRKSIFAIRLTNKYDKEKSQEGLQFAELCAEHMEKYDSYPRALLRVANAAESFLCNYRLCCCRTSYHCRMQSNMELKTANDGMNVRNMILMAAFTLFYIIAHFLLAGKGQDSASINKCRSSLDRNWVGGMMPEIFKK